MRSRTRTSYLRSQSFKVARASERMILCVEAAYVAVFRKKMNVSIELFIMTSCKKVARVARIW